MKRAPAWTTQEFTTLLQNPTLCDAELARLLPQRSEGAVGVVRSGIHSYHRGLNTSMLSKMMLRQLADERRPWTCPKCGKTFPNTESSQPKQPKLQGLAFSAAGSASGETGNTVVAAILRFGKRVARKELFPVQVPEAAELLLGDPYAFALATCLDRGTRSEIITTIPYYIKQDLGHLEPARILQMSLDELRDLYYRLPYRPRYVEDAPRTTRELTAMVVHGFNGDASRMWEGKSAAQVKRTFRNIYGVGEQISNMAVLLIEKAFGVRFSDLERHTIDIKADVHTRRILYRAGASRSQSEQDTIAAARRLHPSHPGALDAPLWIIGRRWCMYQNPRCAGCPLDKVCAKRGV